MEPIIKSESTDYDVKFERPTDIDFEGNGIEYVDIKSEDKVITDYLGRTSANPPNVDPLKLGSAEPVLKNEYDAEIIEANESSLGADGNEQMESNCEDNRAIVEEFVNKKESWDRENFSRKCTTNCVVKEEEEDAPSKTGEIHRKHIARHINTIHLGILNSGLQHSKLKIHKCSKCDYFSTDKSILDYHRDTFHPEVKKQPQLKLLMCSECDYSSTDKSTLVHHMEAFHTEERTSNCSQYKLSTSRESDSKLKRFKCFYCDYSTARKVTLENHKNSIHLNLKKYDCAYCDFSTTWQQCLKGHIDAIHSKLRKFECPQCDFTASQKRDLKIHKDAIHLKVKRHHCLQCNYSTAQKNYIKRHIEARHLKLKKFDCSFCDYSTNWKASLKKHEDVVHLKVGNNKCAYCNYSSTLQGNVNRHMTNVHLTLKKYK